MYKDNFAKVSITLLKMTIVTVGLISHIWFIVYYQAQAREKYFIDRRDALKKEIEEQKWLKKVDKLLTKRLRETQQTVELKRRKSDLERIEKKLAALGSLLAQGHPVSEPLSSIPSGDSSTESDH